MKISKWILAYVAVDDQNQIKGVYFTGMEREVYPNQKPITDDSSSSGVHPMLKQLDYHTHNQMARKFVEDALKEKSNL